MYSVQLAGVMATEAALMLITNIQNLTEGLDLDIAVLFLQEQIHHSKSDQNNATQLEILGTSSVIIAIIILLIFLSIVMVICFLLYRKYFKYSLTHSEKILARTKH